MAVCTLANEKSYPEYYLNYEPEGFEFGMFINPAEVFKLAPKVVVMPEALAFVHWR